MGMDEAFFKQLVETFGAEMESLLKVITTHLQMLEKGQEIAKSKEEISRSGRNIKVSAGAIEAKEVSRLALLIEKLYASPQDITPEIIAWTFKAVEQLRIALRAFSEKKAPPPEFDALIRQLDLPQEEKKSKTKEPSPPPKEEFMEQIVEVFKAELEEKLVVITNNLLEVEKRGEGLDFTKKFDEIFRAAHTIKGSGRGVGATDLAEIAHHVETLFSAIQKTKVEISPEIINLCLKAVDAMRSAMQCYSEKKPLTFDLQALLTELKNSAEAKPQAVWVESAAPETPQPQVSEAKKAKAPQAVKVESAAPEAPPPKASEFESIRVELSTLDRVSAFLEEMQMNKIAIEDIYGELTKINFRTLHFIQDWKKQPGKNPETLLEIGTNIDRMHKEMRTKVNEMRILFNALQEEVRMLRLVPVTLQLSNLPRIVRDLAYNLHKKVNLEINDNKVKIDKMVLDALKDPLVHILRNSIDHGMEEAEVRKAQGKPEVGTIKIDVQEEGSNILFKIADDGAGINVEKVIQTALKKNILSKAEAAGMKEEELLELIFRPGFSTKETATEVSGRGVGLDAVKTNLAALKGQVTLKTELGKGTVFILKVPLTLATERGLIVRCAGQLFVLTTSSVERVMLIKHQDIIDIEGVQAILIDKQPVLVGALSDILELEEKPENKSLWHVVIIQKEWNRVALLVDEIIGEKEIVLKPLQAPLTNNPCTIGATLSGSNQIIYVLNAARIILRTIQSKKRVEAL